MGAIAKGAIAEGATNWAQGCWATFNGNGEWSASNESVKPDSLFYAQLAERLGPMDVKPPEDPTASLAAFTVPGQAKGVHTTILDKMKEDGVMDMTAKFGPRLVEKERCAYLRPWVIHADAPVIGPYMSRAIATTHAQQASGRTKTRTISVSDGRPSAASTAVFTELLDCGPKQADFV